MVGESTDIVHIGISPAKIFSPDECDTWLSQDSYDGTIRVSRGSKSYGYGLGEQHKPLAKVNIAQNHMTPCLPLHKHLCCQPHIPSCMY